MAMTWIDFEDIIKTFDISHCKSFGYDGISYPWEFNDTDWNMAWRPYGLSLSKLPTYANGQISFTNTKSISYRWVTKKLVAISKISFDIQFVTNASLLANVGSRYQNSVAHTGTDSTDYTNASYVVRNSYSVSKILDTITDSNWHSETVILTQPFIFDYVEIYIDGSSSFSINFKNVKFYGTFIETSNGGGATHIAKVTGQLKNLSSNLSDILIVSGGGGGGFILGSTTYDGKDAGGVSGSGDNSADQSTGYAFGQGESGTNVSGGGSGLYGGYKGTSEKSGGAGSGYIGNSLLSNKKMVGFNVPTSSSASTKTESTNEYSESGGAGLPKAGNGKAKIKFLRDNE